MTEADRVDAVVIGSGFGGAVATARLAQAGLSVRVLERGRRWAPGDFPRDTGSLDHDWLWATDHGLYDIRWLDRMAGVQAAGWGGGSLVYANVFARPPRDVFDVWPDGYDRKTLDPYYDLVAHMLAVSPVGADPLTGDVPTRTRAMEAAVARLHRPTGTVRPLLAVTFAPPGHTPQAGQCTFVGECMLGCNQGAKNSVDRNYLTIAERAGAVASVLCEVDRIEPGADGYTVHYADHGAGRRRAVTAGAVFLAAGAVATTELLLRNRDRHGTLPRLSPTLGRGFSGNGDFLAFLTRPRTQLDPGRGPTITTRSVVDCRIRGRRVWFQPQDGAYPARIAELVRAVTPLPEWARSHRPRRGRSETMALLMMGRDSSDGVLTLDHQGEARVAWRNRPNGALYRAQTRAAHQVARQLGGRVRLLPTWAFLRTAITVHNLGGVPMGPDAGSGTIDGDGEVHGYPGLYVVDGAGIPASTGVNPSATIAAVAERRVETAIRTLTGDIAWRAPEHADVRPVPAPEDAAIRAARQWRESPADPSPRPVHFRERMTGTVTVTDAETERTQPLRLRLDVELPDTGTPRGRPAPPAVVSGWAAQGARRVQVRGTLELFPDVAGTFMSYRLRYTDGRSCHGELTGAKVHGGGPLPRLRDLVTLPVLLDHHTGSGHARVTGTVRISAPDLVALGLSLRGSGRTVLAAAATIVRFAAYFVATAVRRTRAARLGTPS